MRHYTYRILLILSVMLMLAGCGQSDSTARKSDNGNSVEKAINDQIAQADTEQSDTESISETSEQITTESTSVVTEQVTTESANGSSEQTTTEGTSEATEKVTTEAAIETSEQAASENTGDTGEVDYDLTDMNSDMVYATVYQMMADPDSYVGKTIKMSGPFYPYMNTDGTTYYPACIIEDALACCSQGLEFVVPGAVYPDDYPEWGTVITVVGTFETYKEGDWMFCHLNNAVME